MFKIVQICSKPDCKWSQVDGKVQLECPNEEEAEMIKHFCEKVPEMFLVMKVKESI